MTYQIEDCKKKDLPFVHEIVNDTLGESYLSEAEIAQYLQLSQHTVRVVKNEKDEVAGFVFAYTLPFSSFCETYQLSENEKGMDSKTIAVLKTIAIHPDFKSQGLGTLLMQDFLTIAEKNQSDLVGTIAWKHKNTMNLSGLLKKFRFEERNTLERFWEEDSKERNFQCFYCGNPCVCDAVIFVKKLA